MEKETPLLKELLLETLPKILGPGAKVLKDHPNPPTRALFKGPVDAKLKTGQRVKLIKTRWFNGSVDWLTDSMKWVRDVEIAEFNHKKAGVHA